MIIGIDIGNAKVKTSEGVIFDSKVSKDTDFSRNDILEYKGERYALGEGVFDNTYRKVEKDNYIKLLIGALALSTDDDINKIVVGLPLSQYIKDREILENIIMSNAVSNIKINGIARKLMISDVEVVAEGILVPPANFEGIVIDVGGRTTDIAYITIENGRRKINNPLSIPSGVLNLYSVFINRINKEFSLNLNDYEAARIIKNGLMINGIEQDIDSALDVFDSFVLSLKSKIELEYNIKTNRICLLGGGGKMLYNTIDEHFDTKIELVKDSVFANANNYKKAGEYKWL